MEIFADILHRTFYNKETEEKMLKRIRLTLTYFSKIKNDSNSRNNTHTYIHKKYSPGYPNERSR